MNYLKSVSLTLFLLVNALGMGPFFPALDDSPSCSDEDYAIFGAVLDNLYGKYKVQSIVLLSLTSLIPEHLSNTSHVPGDIKTLLERAPEDARIEFTTRNKSAERIEVVRIKSPFITVSLSNQEADNLVRRKEGWQRFHEKYPTALGIAGISLPGVSRDHSHAVIYIGMSCGPLCSGSALLLLEKEKGAWKVVDRATVGMS